MEHSPDRLMGNLSRAPQLPTVLPEPVQKAYLRALWGLTHQGAKALQQPLQSLETLSPAAAGETLLIAAMVSRLSDDVSEGKRRLLQAADSFSGSPRAAQVELLLLESAFALGQPEEAKKRLAEVAPKLEPAAAQLLLAHQLLLRGRFEDGFKLVEQAARPPGVEAAWLDVLEGEAALDAGWLSEAARRFGRVLEAEPLGEPLMRALCGVAFCQALKGAGDAAAQVARARGYCVNVPRYLAQAELAGAVATLGSAADKALSRAEAALTLLAERGHRFDEARMGALFNAALSGHAHRLSHSPLARSRELLSRMGLSDRLSVLSAGAAHAERPTVFWSMMAGAQGPRSGSVFAPSMTSGSRFVGSKVVAPSLATTSLAGAEDVELAALFELSRQLASSLKLDEVLQRVLDQVLKVLKAERGALLKLDGDGVLSCVAARGLDPARVKPDGDEISFSVLKEAGRVDGPVLSDNAQLDPRFRGNASVLSTDIRSVLCAPLRTSRGRYGYLYADSRLAQRSFREHHRELFGVFATQAAVAIENATTFEAVERSRDELDAKVQERTLELLTANRELSGSLEKLKTTELKLAQARRDALEKELNLARDIQQALIPKRGVLAAKGLQLSGLVEPAFFCGGDMWCFFPVGDQRTLLFIGDVTGHGVGAGLIAAVAKAAADTYLGLSAQPELSGFLKALSQAIYASGGSSLTMTAFAALVDPAQRTLDFASAGHEFPYLLERADGLPRLVPLTARGPRLGEGPSLELSSQRRSYAAGDRLLLYTDGLTSRLNAEGRPWGARRLGQVLVGLAQKGLDDAVQAIYQQAKEWGGEAELDDDITVMLAELG